MNADIRIAEYRLELAKSLWNQYHGWSSIHSTQWGGSDTSILLIGDFTMVVTRQNGVAMSTCWIAHTRDFRQAMDRTVSDVLTGHYSDDPLLMGQTKKVAGDGLYEAARGFYKSDDEMANNPGIIDKLDAPEVVRTRLMLEAGIDPNKPFSDGV